MEFNSAFKVLKDHQLHNYTEKVRRKII